MRFVVFFLSLLVALLAAIWSFSQLYKSKRLSDDDTVSEETGEVEGAEGQVP